MAAKTLIVGCGYIGLPLALRAVEEGREVSVWVHSQPTADKLVSHPFRQVIVGSVADEALWKKLGTYDRVIHCASSGRGGADAYREVFLTGARNMAAYQPRARRLLVSSTSVYGQAQGEIVTEESAAEPSTETGRILREAEQVALAANSIVMRSSGIYGPQRGVLFEKLRRGEAVIEGDGSRWINMIHQQDLVAAIAHLMEHGEQGQVYNATDDTPVTYLDFYTWCAAFLQCPLPPFGPVNLQRKRGLTNKRVANARLRASGWQPLHPSFREGLRADFPPD